jgi:dipeptidase
VAIGNEALHTREEPGDVGFLGMDLIRLGLERGRSADEAKRVVTTLLERYGQGGSAAYGGTRRYHNSFIIADPETAWVLETSARHWVARRVRGRAAISNLATITDDWDEASAGIEDYAASRGWWRPTPRDRRFDFRAAFENPEPRYRAEARYEASCRFLALPGKPDVPDLMRHLRDHYEGGTVHYPGKKDGDPRGWSICMHPEPSAGATAASMVVELARARGSLPAPVTAWCSQTTPCTAVFLPVAVDAALPPRLTAGTGDPDDRSTWWLLKGLGDRVLQDPAARTPRVQAIWGRWEARMREEVAGDPATARGGLETRVDELLATRQQLLDQVDREA